MKRKWLSILLSVCMVLTLLPTVAFAEGEISSDAGASIGGESQYYTSFADAQTFAVGNGTSEETTGLYILGQEITSENAEGNFSDLQTGWEGTWSYTYNSSNSSLTLSNVKMSNVGTLYSGEDIISYNSDSSLALTMQNCAISDLGDHTLLRFEGKNNDNNVSVNFFGTNHITGGTGALFVANAILNFRVNGEGDTAELSGDPDGDVLLDVDLNVCFSGSGRLSLDAHNASVTDAAILNHNNSQSLYSSTSTLVYDDGEIEIDKQVWFNGKTIVKNGAAVANPMPEGIAYDAKSNTLTISKDLTAADEGSAAGKGAALLETEGDLTIVLSQSVKLTGSNESFLIDIENGTLTLRAEEGVSAELTEAYEFGSAIYVKSGAELKFDGDGTITMQTVPSGSTPWPALHNNDGGKVTAPDGSSFESYVAKVIYADRKLTECNPLAKLVVNGKDLLDPDVVPDKGVKFDPKTATLTLTGAQLTNGDNGGISFKGDLTIVIAEAEQPTRIVQGIISSNNGNLSLVLNSTKDNVVGTLNLVDGLTVTGVGKLLLNPDGTNVHALSSEKGGKVTICGESVSNYAGSRGIINNGTYRFYTPTTNLKVMNKDVLPTVADEPTYWLVQGGTLTDEGANEQNYHVKAESVDGIGRLTLNNAKLVGDGTGNGIDCAGELELVLCGENTMTVFTDGVFTDNGSLTVSGEGSLNAATSSHALRVSGCVVINGGTVTATSVEDDCISANAVTINNGTVSATADGAGGYGISANDVTISGGDVTASGKNGISADAVTISGGTVQATGKAGNGIYADNTVTINDSKVTASGKEYGILANDTVTISGGTVQATGEAEHGIYAYDVTISGGEVTASGVEKGIYAYDVTISGGEVTASGNDQGITSTNAVTMSGGKVTASGKSYGIGAAKEVTINNGTVSATADGAGGYGISANDVTISGGDVTASGVENGISAGRVTISGGTITATGKAGTGIYTNGSTNGEITISGNVTASGNRYGILTEKVTINDGTVSATADGEGGYGISADAGAVTMNGGTITVTSVKGTGIYASQITTSGGKVTISAGQDGIIGRDSVNISDSSVNVQAKKYGINSCDTTIKDSTVSVTADDALGCGIYANEEITISGGVVTVNAGEIAVNGGNNIILKDVSILESTPENAEVCHSYIGLEDETYATYVKIGEVKTVTFDANGHGTAPEAQKVVYSEKAEAPAELTETGYTFGGWYKDAACTTAWDFDTAVTEDITLYAKWTKKSSGGSSSGGSSSGGASNSTTTTTTTNEDGSTTTTTTDKATGTVTETTKNPDGSTTVVETKKDGTETVTEKDAEGNTTETVTAPDGSATTTDKQTNGVTTETKTDKNGEITDVSVTVPETVKDGAQAVIPADLGDKKGKVTAEVTYPDGTKKTVKAVYENGEITVPVDGSAEIAIQDDFAPVKEVSFKDVPTGAYYEDAVQWAAENEITNGTSDTTFAPAKDCSRGQVVTFLYRAFGAPAVNGNSTFSDVKSGAYYEDAVKWAAENGITGGTGNGKFAPDTDVTRAQFVTMLWRAAGSPVVNYAMNFKDVASDSYYTEAIRWAASEGITTGSGADTFSPSGICNRAQIVTFLFRYFGE